MSRISHSTTIGILIDWYSGFLRDEIPPRRDAGGGSVSRTIKKWGYRPEALHDPELNRLLDRLREIAVQFRKNGWSIDEMSQATELLVTLKEIGVGTKGAKGLLLHLMEANSDEDHPIKEHVRVLESILSKMDQHEKPLWNVISYVESLLSKIPESKETLRALQQQIQNARRSSKKILARRRHHLKISGTTDAKLDQYDKDKTLFQKYNIDLGLSASILRELQALERTVLVEILRNYASLQSAVRKSQESLDDLEGVYSRRLSDQENLLGRVDELNSRIQELKDDIQGLENAKEQLLRDHSLQMNQLEEEHRVHVISLGQKAKDIESSYAENLRNRMAVIKAEFEGERDTLEKKISAKKEAGEKEYVKLQDVLVPLRIDVRYMIQLKSQLDRTVGNIGEIKVELEKTKDLFLIVRLLESPDQVEEHPQILFRSVIPILYSLTLYFTRYRQTILDADKIKELLEKLLKEMNSVITGATATR